MQSTSVYEHLIYKKMEKAQTHLNDKNFIKSFNLVNAITCQMMMVLQFLKVHQRGQNRLLK